MTRRIGVVRRHTAHTILQKSTTLLKPWNLPLADENAVVMVLNWSDVVTRATRRAERVW